MLSLAAGMLAACSRAPEPAQFTGATMGTTYHVTVLGVDDDMARKRVQAAIDAVLLDADQHLSTYNEASEISLLNRDESGQWQEVSPSLFLVLQEALRVNDLTNGAFDVTVLPLLALWGHDAAGTGRSHASPTTQRIEEAQRSVGRGKIELRRTPRSGVRKTAPKVRLTVDGIAPGYAVDRIAGDFMAMGYRRFIIEIGGEVRAHGERPEGGPWRIAIEVPHAVGREPRVGIRLRDAAVSTSGDYRDERVDKDGRRYSQTIDPRTGRTQSLLRSVTVIDPNAIRADAYATALMVMGTEAGGEWAKSLRLPVLFVERSADPGEWRLVESPAFKEWRE